MNKFSFYKGLGADPENQSSFFIPPLMIFGFATALFGKIHYILGLLPAYICYGILTYMVFIIKGLSKVPYGFFVWAPQH